MTAALACDPYAVMDDLRTFRNCVDLPMPTHVIIDPDRVLLCVASPEHVDAWLAELTDVEFDRTSRLGVVASREVRGALDLGDRRGCVVTVACSGPVLRGAAR